MNVEAIPLRGAVCEPFAVGTAPVEEFEVEAPEDGASDALPKHLVGVTGGKQALWRCAGLRGAGFPASDVLKLAAPECGAAADEIMRTETEARRVRSSLIDSLLREAKSTDDPERRASLERAVRRVQKGKLPQPQDVTPDFEAAIEEFRRAAECAGAAVKEYQRTFQESGARVSQAIREVAMTRRFQEAIIWQNRQAFHTGIDALIRKNSAGQTRSSKQRQHEELVASYLQRYSVKNDTIGFFGPIGWTNFASEGEAISVRPGASLLAERNVYFEGWCLDILAEKLSRNRALRPWLAPRRVPFIYVEGTTLHVPHQRPTSITPTQAAVLGACDGLRPAKELARELMGDAASGIKSEAEFYRAVDAMCKMGIMMWAFELPFDVRPEQFFLRLVERIEDENLRRQCLAPFVELDDARRRIAAAAGDPAELERAISDLEATFTRLTGESPTRSAGQTYAARTLIYEDCRRDVEVKIGPSLLGELGPTLSLLLTSARWNTHRVAEGYRQAFREMYLNVSRQTGSPTIELVDFWQQAHTILFGDGAKIIDAVTSELTERWAGILDLPPGQNRVYYRSEDLSARVAAAFDAPDAGWQLARYHSPDVMIAAPSVEAIRRGEYELVMGEIHVGSNTLGANLFLEQHPALEEIFEALESDMPQPRLAPVLPRYWPGLSGTTRIIARLVSPKDIRLVAANDSCGVEKSKAVLIGELVVADTPGGLVVRTRDGRLQFDIVEAFGDLLSGLTCSTFELIPRARHTPRIYIDRVIVNRESWSLPATDLQFAFEKDEANRFIAARRWARSHGLPRMIFAKVPVERKPFFVDFDSPTYVNMFAKMVRRTAESDFENPHVNMSEMVPDFTQLWLPDADGQIYTSEFRVVSLNLE